MNFLWYINFPEKVPEEKTSSPPSQAQIVSKWTWHGKKARLVTKSSFDNTKLFDVAVQKGWLGRAAHKLKQHKWTPYQIVDQKGKSKTIYINVNSLVKRTFTDTTIIETAL